MSDVEVNESGGDREDWLDEIIEQWEQLRSDGNELTVEALCEHDENLAGACQRFPGLLEEAEEEIRKLRLFDRSYGDLVELEPDGSRQDIDPDDATQLQSDASKPLSNPDEFPRGSANDDASPSSGRDAGPQRIHPGTKLVVDAKLTVESRIDGGGLGDIYRAADDSLRRPVAVKLIRNYADNRHYTRRFLREATVTAQLNGPGVIPIYGYGTAGDGQPFYVMRLIDGDGFDEKIKSYHVGNRDVPKSRRMHSVEFQRLLRYFVSICRTVSYAHDMGVVHCDLKPQNIKVGKYDEVFVLDWGEATSCGSRLDVPRHHSGRISPAYAPPELASGTGQPTPTSDIYSLGMILYEVLLGRRAADDSPSERDSRLRAGHISRALTSICLKGMEAQRQQRYSTVRDMADDIEKWMADEPVAVHRYTPGERVARSLRRYTTVTQIAAVCVISLLILAAILSFSLTKRIQLQREAQIETLMVSAGLSADNIAGEIDRRIVFLEGMGREIKGQANLIDNIVNPADPPSVDEPDSELMTWLNDRLREPGVPDASSWFILSDEGIQIAKQVDSTQDRAQALESLGKTFNFRDYFHGRGRDLNEEDVAEHPPEPIREPHLSRRYISSTTNEIRVAITVPLRNEKSEVIGVLGMSFAIDRLSFVSSRLSKEDSLILVDTREDSDGQQPGLMVVHPGYRQQALRGFEVKYRSLSPSELERLKNIQRRRRVQLEQTINQPGDRRLPRVDNYLEQFVDPVDEHRADVGAALEPIMVRHRGSLIETGLVAIVRGQEL